MAPLYRFRTDEAALKMTNDCPTLTLPPEAEGKGGSPPPIFYSRDICRIARALEYGIVGINEGIISAKATGEIAPFGGMKEGGIGR